jgi:predicted MFS family arabinose efflux permease
LSDAAPPAPDSPPGGRRLPGFLSAFAFPSYRRLWTGAFLSSLGTWTQDVALAWLIHTRIGDPVYLGFRAFAAEAPLLAFLLVGGAVADRADRRRILLASQLVQMSLAMTLAVLYGAGRLGIAAILVIAFVTGLAQSQSAPTYQAVFTSLVPPREIQNAVALNSLQFNLSRAIGPVIAGVLLARAGTGVCFVVNALSFVAVMVAIWRIDLPAPGPRSAESFTRSLSAGLRHVVGNPVLSMLTLLGFAGSFLAYPLITYMPVIAGDVLRTGATGYSLLLSSFGFGAIAGAIATAHRGHVPGRGRTLLRAFMAYGVVAAAAVTSRHQTLSMALLAVSGWCLVTAFSTLNSLVQENAQEALKGRILSIFGLAFRGGMPLGSLVAGFLVRPVGAPAAIGAFGLALVVIAASVYWRDRRVTAL